MGHAFVCDIYEQEYSISLSLFGRSNVVCQGNSMNKALYGAAGGLSVMSVSLALLLMPGIRTNVGMRVGFVSIVSVSFVNTILEGFFYDFYNGNLFMSELGLLAVLLLVFIGQFRISSFYFHVRKYPDTEIISCFCCRVVLEAKSETEVAVGYWHGFSDID